VPKASFKPRGSCSPTLEKQCEKAKRSLTALERELAKIEAEVNAEKKRAEEVRKRLDEIVDAPGCDCWSSGVTRKLASVSP
jgi:flagellar motility protein MotE (MotC chaperone)